MIKSEFLIALLDLRETQSLKLVIFSILKLGSYIVEKRDDYAVTKLASYIFLDGGIIYAIKKRWRHTAGEW